MPWPSSSTTNRELNGRWCQSSRDDVDGAGLRPHIALLLAEAHFAADRELLEGATHHAVAMEVDQAAVVRLDASEILIRMQLADAAMRWADVRLGRRAPFAFVVLELASGGPEGVAQRDVGILVRMANRMASTDRDLAVGNRDVHPDFEEPALLLVLVRRFDDHVTVHDMRAEFVQPLGQLANARFERRRGLHVTERNLQRQSHVVDPAYRFPGIMLAAADGRGNSRMYVDATPAFSAPQRPPVRKIAPYG